MDRRIFAVAMLLLLAASFVAMTSGEDVESASTTPEVGDNAVVDASGICGTATGAAKWTYSRSEGVSDLRIASGSVENRSAWKIEALSIDGKEVAAADLANYKMTDILAPKVALTINGSVSATAGAIRA